MKIYWKDAKLQPPIEYGEAAHHHKLWCATDKYGEMVGFYHNGKFMRDYACEILNVHAYIELPRYDEPQEEIKE